MSGCDAVMLAYDPGGEHCGVAVFHHEPEPPADFAGQVRSSWRCHAAYELTPAAALDELRSYLTDRDAPRVTTVAYETFRLRPDMAQTLTGSEMETSQQIGAIKWICRDSGLEPSGYEPGVKKATASVLRELAIKSQAKRAKAGEHAKMAELIGWHHLLKAEIDALTGPA